MAAFDWLTGDSSEKRQDRRIQRAREAAEAQLRAEEHAAWLRSLSPEQRAIYDLQQEMDKMHSTVKELESELRNVQVDNWRLERELEERTR